MIARLRIAAILAIITVVTAVLAPIQILALRFDWPIRRRLPRYWHRCACWLLGIKIHTSGALSEKRPLLVSSNHASWLDILVLGAVADVAYVAKSEVAAWPIFSMLAKLQATIFIEREDRRKTGNQVSEIATRLKGGEIIVLFPEGTTSDGNRMLPVKTSLFGAAANAIPFAPDGVVYIQPVAVAYTRLHGMPMGHFHRPVAAWPGDVELVPHLQTILKIGALDAEVTFCAPIAFTKDSNRKQTAWRVEEELGNALLQALRNPQ